MQGTRATGHRGGYSKSYAFRGAARQLTDGSRGLEQSWVSCPLEKPDLPARTATRAHPFDLSCCRFGFVYHLTSKLSGPAPPTSPIIIPEPHSRQYPEAGRAIAAASAGGVIRAAPLRQFVDTILDVSDKGPGGVYGLNWTNRKHLPQLLIATKVRARTMSLGE